jgi:hypothetical protein
LHLLPLHHPLAHHLVHCRFHKSSRDSLPVPVSLAVVRKELPVVLDVAIKFSQLLQQLVPAFRISCAWLQVPLEIFDALQCALDVAMPDIPFETLELFLDAFCSGAPACSPFVLASAFTSFARPLAICFITVIRIVT